MDRRVRNAGRRRPFPSPPITLHDRPTHIVADAAATFVAAPTDDDLTGIVALALDEAQGLDYIGQTEHAVHVVLAARPEMTASDALQAVNTWRRG